MITHDLIERSYMTLALCMLPLLALTARGAWVAARARLFRHATLLAGLFGLCGTLAFRLVWWGTWRSDVGDIVLRVPGAWMINHWVVPGTALMMAVSLVAIVYGISTEHEHWPFRMTLVMALFFAIAHVAL